MKISSVSDTVTVIELSCEELQEYDFSFDEGDCSSPKARKVLWSIIDKASRLTGKAVEINPGLEIDLLPDIKGGCLLIISQNFPVSPLLYDECQLYESRNIDNLLDFARAAECCKTPAESCLYYLKGVYRLIIKGDACLHLLAREFNFTCLDYAPEGDSTREGYNCLIEKNALEILGGLASE